MKEIIVTIKNEGTYSFTLNEEIAPLATASVMRLAKMGKYNNKKVERLEPNFVFQPLFYDGVDKDIDEELEPEFETNPMNHQMKFTKGIVAMAGAEHFASAGQYFITLAEAPRLNGKFTVIGEITKGMDLIDELANREVIELVDEASGFKYHQPKEEIIIERVDVKDE